MASLAGAAALPDLAQLAGPFKFLDYYEERDADLFAGREVDIQEVVARIVMGRTFVLYGRSGLGKTSLMLAGVVPELRRRGIRPVYVRTLEDPVTDLREAVLEVFGEVSGGGAPTLRGLFAKVTPGGTLVIVLDQFEEFFIRFRDDRARRESFIRQIAEVVDDPELDARFVFSLREDYVAELDDFRKYLPGLFKNEYRLKPLTAFGARQAVAAPLVNNDVEFDDELLIELVEELSRFGFDPTILQIVCSEVYRQARTRERVLKPRLTVADLKEVGGVEGIFRRYLDDFVTQISEGQELLTRVVLDSLITGERTKKAVTLDMLRGGEFIADKEELEEVLRLLVDRRVVRKERRGEQVWYELIHERLVELVLDWLELDVDFFRFRSAKDFVANAARSGIWRESPQTLLSPGQFATVVRPFGERLRFNGDQQEFLVWSLIFRSPEVAGSPDEAAYCKDLRYWSEIFGVGRTHEVIRTQLDSEDRDWRLAAAAAARAMPDQEGELAARCFELAMSDSDEEVRRAAGASLTNHAAENGLAPKHLARIQQALEGDGPARQSATELLADLHAGEVKPADLGWWQKRRARLLAERRRMASHRDRIDRLTKRGATAGAVGGLVWLVTTGAALAYLGLSLVGAGTQIPLEVVTVYLSLGAALTAGIGALLGWASVSASVRSAILGGRCLPSSSSSPRLFYALLLPALLALWPVGMLALEPLELDTDLEQIAIAFALPPLAALAASAIALFSMLPLLRLVLPGITGHRSRLSILSWSLLFGAGMPLLLLFVPLTLARQLLLQSGGDVEGFGLAVSLQAPLVGSFVATVISFAIALCRSAEGPGQRKAPRGRVLVWVSRGASALAVILVVGFVGYAYGFDSVPLLGTRYEMTAGGQSQTLTGRFGRFLPDSDYFQLDFGSADLQLVSISGEPDYGSARWAIDGMRVFSATTLLLPPGSSTVSVSRFDVDGVDAAKLIVTPLPLEDCGSVILDRVREVVFARCTLNWRAPGEWAAPVSWTFRTFPGRFAAPGSVDISESPRSPRSEESEWVTVVEWLVPRFQPAHGGGAKGRGELSFEPTAGRVDSLGELEMGSGPVPVQEGPMDVDGQGAITVAQPESRRVTGNLVLRHRPGSPRLNAGEVQIVFGLRAWIEEPYYSRLLQLSRQLDLDLNLIHSLIGSLATQPYRHQEDVRFAVMRLTESFGKSAALDRLVRASEASEAVPELSWLWAARALAASQLRDASEVEAACRHAHDLYPQATYEWCK